MFNGSCPRLYVDFNELVEPDLVLLAQDDHKVNSVGNIVTLYEGLHVAIYSEDRDALGNIDNLIAEGIVEKNMLTEDWTKNTKWLCRISKPGIRHQSETQI